MEPQHLSSPLSFSSQGHLNTTIQSSPENREQRALNVALCEEGYRQDLPEFGVPPLLFGVVPLELAPFRAAIERWTGTDISIEELEGIMPSDRKVVIEA